MLSEAAYGGEGGMPPPGEKLRAQKKRAAF